MCFSEGKAIRLNKESRLVSVAKEDYTVDIAYDYLVIAFGRRLEAEKISGFFEFAHHLLDIEAALKFGEAVKHFRGGKIVVGMCPGGLLPGPVCEAAFALERRFEAEISEKKISITVVFPETVREAFAGAKIFGELECAFEKHDIELVESFPVHKISEDKIFTGNGQTMPYDLLMLVPPFKGQEMTGNSNSTDDSGFVLVNKFMQVADSPQTYAVGDCTAMTGPKLAHIAVRQAAVAAFHTAADATQNIL